MYFEFGYFLYRGLFQEFCHLEFGALWLLGIFSVPGPVSGVLLPGVGSFMACRAERASNLTFSECLHLVDLNNPRILMTHDKMAVTANIRA